MRRLKMIGISVLIGLISLFIFFQIYMTYSIKDIESYNYDLIKTYPNFEIRLYEEALFSCVTIPRSTHKESASKGFKVLAGYIFGGNSRSEKIAMTSPVEMIIDDSITVKFMVPKSHNMENLPQPNNTNIKFKKEPSKYIAALKFGGFTNDNVIKSKITELKELLDNAQITPLNSFSYMGYNPPYQLFNRRNEIVVEIDFSSVK